MTNISSDTRTLAGITVKDKQGKSIPLTQLLSKPLTLVHFQNSYRAGQTCRVMMPMIEAHLADLKQYGEPIVVVREEPMDKGNPADTPVQQVLMTKADLNSLGVLGEDTYIRRTSFIVAQSGKVLATLPVPQDELTTHIEKVVLPLLAELKAQL